ncbi:hypothetical protein vseg_007811 [Gypsophila vaccaria]
MSNSPVRSKNVLFSTLLSTVILLVILSMITEVKGDDYHFHIRNDIGRWPVVTYRCQSGDEDLGYKQLRPGEDFHYKFKPGWLWSRTLYFCHFYFDGKNKMFDVWREEVDAPYCRRLDNKLDWHQNCYRGQLEWVIRDDGFYKHCIFVPRNDHRCKGNHGPQPDPCKLEKVHGW